MNTEPAPEISLLQHLSQRKLVQWTLAYAAGAWVIFEVADGVGSRWNLPDVYFQGLVIVLAVGGLVTLLLAWYHGERGQQTVSGLELLILTLLLAAGGFTLSRLDGAGSVAIASVPTPLEAGPLAPSALDDPAVAVLPFAITGDEEADQFADGMHEEVLHALAQVSGLIVKSRQSVLQYRGSTKPMGEIALELGADALVEGSIRAVGDRVRVTVQLIDGRSDSHLWAANFDRVLSATELFSIQEEVAREVARALEVTLTPADSVRLSHRGTHVLDSRTVFLQAQAAQRLSDAEPRRLLHLAISMDSTYDRPWGLLAELVAADAFITNDAMLADSALALAQRALDLNPTGGSGDPYNAIGFVRMMQGRAGDARAAFAEGMQHAPNDPALANNFGSMYATAGLFPEAIAAYRRGIEISPGHIVNRTNLANIYETLDLYPERVQRLVNEAQALQPSHAYVMGASTLSLARKGDPEAAVGLFTQWKRANPTKVRDEYLRTGAILAIWAGDLTQAKAYALEAYQLNPDGLPLLGWHMARVTLGYVLSMEGERTAAETHLAAAYRVVHPLVESGSEFPELPIELAAIEAMRGNRDASIAWLRSAYELGYRYPEDIAMDPIFAVLRGDPEFAGILDWMRGDLAEMRRLVLAMDSRIE